MANLTPVWTDNVSVLAPYALIKGESVRVTLDLRTKYGARLFWAIGFGGSTNLTNGVTVLVRPVFDQLYAAPIYEITTGIDPWIRLINNGSDYALGASSFAYDGHSGKTALAGDLCFFWGVTTIPTASASLSPNHGCEVLRCSKGVTTPLVTDSVSKYSHHDNEYIGLATTDKLWLPGGSTYEIIFDYGDDAAGEAVACMVDCQTYDSELIT